MNRSQQESVAQQVYEISARGPGVMAWLVGTAIACVFGVAVRPIYDRFPGLAAGLLVILLGAAAVLVFHAVWGYNTLLRAISPLQSEADFYKRAYEKELEINEELKAKRDSWRKVVLDAVDNPGDEDVPASLIASLQGENRALKQTIEYLNSNTELGKFEEKDGDGHDRIIEA